MLHLRQPAVAGRFYPARRGELQECITRNLSASSREGLVPKAIIVPHAGYQYSGPIAGKAYAGIAPGHDRISRVLLIGPAHHVRVRGLVVPEVDAFVTPLGEVPLDTTAIEGLLTLPQVSFNNSAHEPEHSLEVQLPFLQTVLDVFRLIPLLVGQATAEEVAEVIERFWDSPETLIVISSDLSHFHDYETATTIDAETSASIERLDVDALSGERACGYRGIQGLMLVARRRREVVRVLDVRNSGDTAGSRERVVGYGAYVVE